MKTVERTALVACLLGAALVLPARADGPAVPMLDCGSSISRNFKPNAGTKVILIKEFKQGDVLPIASGPQSAFDASNTALADLCFVKLLVGPGHPGPAGAPSTSAGIGIEVWLPSKEVWNGRVHALGSGGWVGSEETDLKMVSSYSSTVDLERAPTVAAREGAVTSSTDTGHAAGGSGGLPLTLDGSFAMNPDGSVNSTLWIDFASRGIHEQVVQTKALAEAYYASAPKFTFWDGGSTGGRQALKLAQRFPQDVDGIIAGFPAINWTNFITGALYPQVVIQRDLGGQYLAADQLNLVSNAAIAACDVVGGKHLGFILDSAQCRYDPTKDAEVLCTSDGGKNDSGACVTPLQARAINKIWYGMTSDGSVPDPAVDNGFGRPTGKHRWYGLPRGTNLLYLASQPVFPIAADMVALELQDPRRASPGFHNAMANGEDGWRSLSYEQLLAAFHAGVVLQAQFGFINTDDPDLSAFEARGGKVIHVHGANDGLIPYQGSVNYYERVLARMGGLAAVQKFYRFYLIPGMGHGPYNGTSNPKANPPVPAPLKGGIYRLLTDWVEKGIVPENIILNSTSETQGAMSLPMCAYPHKVTYLSGDVYAAGSYACE